MDENEQRTAVYVAIFTSTRGGDRVYGVTTEKESARQWCEDNQHLVESSLESVTCLEFILDDPKVFRKVRD